MSDEQQYEAKRETSFGDPERLTADQNSPRLGTSRREPAEMARTRPVAISETTPSTAALPTFPPDLVNVDAHGFPVYRPPGAMPWTFPPDLVDVADHEFPVYQPPTATPWTFPKLQLRYPPLPAHLGRQSSRRTQRAMTDLVANRRSSSDVTHRVTSEATIEPQAGSSPKAEATVLQPTTTVRQSRTVIQPRATSEQYANDGLVVRRPEKNGRYRTETGSWLVVAGIVLGLAGVGIYLLMQSNNLG